MGNEKDVRENSKVHNELTILYEDENVLVINKPSGMSVHRDAYTKEEEVTVADWHLARAPQARGVGEPLELQDGTVIDRPGIVHRLDKETSGVMILAKTQEAFEHLKAQFHDRCVKKEYRAFVYGAMKERWGTIDRPIGRSSKDHRLRSAQRGAKGTLRGAVTDWELIGQDNEYAYLRLMPKTGRMHQLRAHLKAINHPIVCDRLYAPNHPCALGFDRLALHAHILEIELPSGETRKYIAPLPQSFETAAEHFTK